MWDRAAAPLQFATKAQKFAVTSVGTVKDGSKIVAAYQDGMIRFFDTQMGTKEANESSSIDAGPFFPLLFPPAI